MVPPGTAGLQPDLSLSYSSGSSANGILGEGWSLSGLSSMVRTPSSLVHDGVSDPVDFDGLDRLSFNGQRLRLVSGKYLQPVSGYRTEIDSFTFFRFEDGYFKAFTKTGLIMEFGKTENARNGKLDWKLSHISDRNGNDMTFIYGLDKYNHHHLKRIDYGGHQGLGLASDNSVELVYEQERPDAPIRYEAAATGCSPVG